MSRTEKIVAINALVPEIWGYSFKRATGADVSLYLCYVDQRGHTLGEQTLTVSSTHIGLYGIPSIVVPANTAGIIIQPSTDLLLGRAGLEVANGGGYVVATTTPFETVPAGKLYGLGNIQFTGNDNLVVSVTGASTIADGADVAEGTTTNAVPTAVSSSSMTVIGALKGFLKGLGFVADTAATDSTSSWSVIAVLKGLWNRLGNLGTAGSSSTDVATVQGIAGMTPLVGVGVVLTPSANFNRTADTNTYAVGDLIAQSVTAGSCSPMQFTAARIAAGTFFIRRAKIKKTSTTTAVSAFRLHLYAASPTFTNGDNGAWLTPESTYLGALDITCDKAFSDGASGFGVPNNGAEISVALSSGQIIYGVIEARAAYVPTSAETFTVTLEVYPN